MFSVLCKRVLKKNAYLHVDFEVRRSRRLSDQMGNDAGGYGVTIDLTSDPENVDVPGMNIRILKIYFVGCDM